MLVARMESPSYNAVFSIAGGVVVQGRLLCTAAVMARELSILRSSRREAMTASATAT